jgi:putative membrane-bound dehydrogenase-like protein
MLSCRSGLLTLFRLAAIAALLAPWAATTLTAAEDADPAPAAELEQPLPASPLSPKQALAAFRVDPGVRVDLVAAEPLVESPVALAFDDRGYMYVAENRGYPTGPDNVGRIARLEDSDGDGTFDRRTEFADGLSYPNGLMAWRDGLLVTCAPDILYLVDTDGDGRSDRREVLFTGFSTASTTQLRASHPQLALDNWIYTTGGLMGGKVTSPLAPDHPAVEFQRADFRFRPDGTEFEVADGGGQFGMAFDAHGHRFILYNRVQVQHVVMPRHYLRRNPHLPGTSVVQDCPADMIAEPLKGHGAAARLYPISKNITTADSHSGSFTAACGLLIYRSSFLPEKYEGCAFTCDPTGNLVHFDHLEPSGATFIARRSDDQREFLASPDDWFRPVNLAEGPDGALYICDMYRKTIEHPEYLPPEIRKHTDFESGKGMGRIWSVRNAEITGPPGLKKHHRARLSETATGELWDQLCLPDCWWRERAHRLLLDRPESLEGLRARITGNSQMTPQSLSIGLGLIDSLGGLDEKTLSGFFSHPDPGVRELVIQLAEPRLKQSPGLVSRVAALADDPDPHVRFQCALTLGEVDDPSVVEPLVKIALLGSRDRWTRLAVESSIAGRELRFLSRLAAEPPPAGGSPELLAELGQLVGTSRPPTEWPEALTTIVAAVRARDFLDQTSAIAGFGEALHRRRTASPNASLPVLVRESAANVGPYFDALLTEAKTVAVDRQESLERRGAAVRLLALGDATSVGEVLLSLVNPHEPSDIAIAAVRSLSNLENPLPAKHLVETSHFSGYSPPLREAVLSAMMSSNQLQLALLAAIESGAVPIGVVDSLRRTQLTGQRDPAVHDLSAKIFAAPASGSRATVYEEYKSALDLTGHADNGRKVFLKTCANCHRLDREGTPVGPDLFGIRNQPKGAILLHILIPEYEITPGFGAYLVETTDGRILAGLLVAETPTQIVLRAALGREETVLRSDIESLTLSKLSLMPQELEKTINHQEMADLLAYLKGESP